MASWLVAIAAIVAVSLLNVNSVGANHAFKTLAVARNLDGTLSWFDTNYPRLSADGTNVVYVSGYWDLVPNDTNDRADVFRYDIVNGTTTRVSVGNGGSESNGNSNFPAVSSDGTKIVYTSGATNLVGDDTNGFVDVFLTDTRTGTTILVSRHTDGTQGNDNAGTPSISGDGKMVSYTSLATNLVDGDTNGRSDIFVYDTIAGTTTRASVDSNGNEANDASWLSSVSGNGTLVVYTSRASNLVDGDTNRTTDVFTYRIASGVTTRVSVQTGGTQAGGGGDSSISHDGTRIAFMSSATDLVVGDSNAKDDVFMVDTTTNKTIRVSVDGAGNQANGGSYRPSISADGQNVAFVSVATNLIDDDSNGYEDIFRYNTASGSVTRISVSSDGEQANKPSEWPSISSDGSKVVYTSSATNLIPSDLNRATDAFLWLPDPTPTAVGFTVSIPESTGWSESIGAVRGFDAQGDPLAFAITAGNGSGLFTIDPRDGWITLTGALDYETARRHVLTVSAADSKHVVNAAVTVNVVNVNDVAPILSDSAVSINEATTLGTPIVRLLAEDIEGDTLIYAMTDPDGFFAINPTNGQVSLIRALDYLARRQHVLNVSVADGVHTTNALLTVSVTPVSGNLFDDDDGSIFEGDIQWLAVAGITSGCGPRLFCPDQSVTRGQMAAFMNRALHLPPTDIDFFTDDDGSIFEADINELAASGITKGCDSKAFCADRPVTRGQMAAFLVRALGLPATDRDFFADDDGSVFERDINRLAASGITKGCNATSFCPNQSLTRGQMAALLRRALS